MGGERIVVDPGLLAVDVRFGPFAHAQEHDLRERESVVFGLLDDGSGFVERVFPE